MTGPRVLIVDDEPQMRRLLQTTLDGHGYVSEAGASGKQALDLAATWRPDVIVLDLGLPKLAGTAVCEAVRSWSAVPIIVLSVRDTERDKIAALDLGADDYLTKPFSLAELLARIRVALRHAAGAGGTTEPVLVFGELRIDLPNRHVALGGAAVHFTPPEYDLLKLLATHSGKVLTHTLLLRTVWGDAYTRDTQTLRVFIGQLRRKLGDDPTRPRFILTEPGVGYRFQQSE